MASRQHGAVSRGQLLAAGITPRQITRRLESGRLIEIHRGVYLVGHGARGVRTVEMAALLACGHKSVLSHRSAAALWSLLPYPATEPVRVTVPPERSVDRSRITAHQATLTRKDVRRYDGMLVTSPPRTILDLASELDLEQLERLVAESNYRHLAGEHELRAQLERNPGKRGVTALRAVLDIPGGPRRTRSPGEIAFLRLLRKHCINGYEVNGKVAGYEVDFLWRDLKFVVEVDGWDGHSGRNAFERDRVKVATLRAAGISVMPVTGRQMRFDEEGVVRRLLGALA